MASLAGVKREDSCWEAAEWNEVLEADEAFDVLRWRGVCEAVVADQPEGKGEIGGAVEGGLTRSGRVLGPVELNDMATMVVEQV